MPKPIKAIDTPKMVSTTLAKAHICATWHHHEHMKKKGGKDQKKQAGMLFDIIEGMLDHIAIITVVYKNYTVLHDFLKSLEAQTSKNFHLYLVDTSPEKKEIKTNVPHTVISAENHGYAHGINVGLRAALENGFKKFCAINNDTFFKEDFICALIDSITYHPASLIGAKIYYAPGYEYHQERYSKEQSGSILWYAGGTVDWEHATTGHRGVDEADLGQYDKAESTDFVTGCCMAFDKAVVDLIGFWDTAYFLYYEDADYCELAKRNGIDLLYDPSIVLWHKNAQSTGGAGSALHQRVQKNALLRFALKYAPWRTSLHVIKNYFLR